MARSRAHALLLTGQPGSGKTTLVRKVVDELSRRGVKVRGFLTEEIRAGRDRVGFRIVDFEGRRARLAHIEIRSAERVGKYGVDVAALDAFVERMLAGEDAKAVTVVDEIGKMESLSPAFRAAIERLLDSRGTVVATVGARGGGLIERVKRRRDVEVLTVTRANRDALVSAVIDWVTESRAASRSNR